VQELETSRKSGCCCSAKLQHIGNVQQHEPS
jgi:hypothetical protein